MRRFVLLAALVFVAPGCKSSSDIVIGVSVVSLLPGQAPTGYQNVTAVVGDRSSGQFVSDARVTVNGVGLTLDSGGSQYVGSVELPPGATVTVTVSARGREYSATATQFATYPTITLPLPDARWSGVCTKDVAWTRGSPETSASYRVDVFSVAQPNAYSLWSGSPIPAGSPESAHAQVPQLPVSVETPALVTVTIFRQVQIPDADPQSALIVGGASATPVTVDPRLKDVSSIAIAPPDLIFPAGGVVPYVANATFCDGTMDAVTEGVAWSTADAAVAVVEADGGLARLVGPGRTTISAGVGAVTGTTSVTIQGQVQDSGIANDDLTGVGWSGSTYVAVGRMGTILSSPDGLRWTDRTLGLTRGALLGGVASSGSRFVVVGCPTASLDLSTAVLTSPDGITWTAQDAGLRNECLTAVTWTGAEFVAVGTTGKVVSSGDGVGWTLQDAGLSESALLSSVASSGSRLVAVGIDNNLPLTITSEDGRAWTTRDLGVDAGEGRIEVNGVAWSGTRFVVVGGVMPFVSDGHEEGGLILTSADGVNWVRQASGTGHDATLYKVVSTGTRLLAIGPGVLSSPQDGTTWTPWMSNFQYPPVWQRSAMAGSDVRFVLVGGFGMVITGP